MLVNSPMTKMRKATPMLLSVMAPNIIVSGMPPYTFIGLPAAMLASVISI